MLVTALPQAFVVPLGDSNTVRNTWRSLLAKEARAAGKELFSLGSVSNATDYNHEGHSGFTVNDIEAAFAGYAALYPRPPHYIITMLGTNGLPGDIATDYPALLATIAGSVDVHGASLSASRIIVSSIPVQPADQTNVDAWNAALPGIVSDAVAAGIDCEFFDACAGIVDADLDDGVHLSAATGQPKLAANWWSRLQTGG